MLGNLLSAIAIIHCSITILECAFRATLIKLFVSTY
jgi:hypothetical protein